MGVDVEGLAAFDQREVERAHPSPLGRDAEQEVFPVQREGTYAILGQLVRAGCVRILEEPGELVPPLEGIGDRPLQRAALQHGGPVPLEPFPDGIEVGLQHLLRLAR